jgi:4-amino-4-deoxy-L-arabinose transferase-like glycosyltransferase
MTANRRILSILVLGAVVLSLAAVTRGPEYDEGYKAFVTGGVARPDWPRTPFRVAEMRAAFLPAPTPGAILETLRRTDVHPPLYFWLAWGWRHCFGPDLRVTRMLSVLLSLGALALVGVTARVAGLPPGVPMLLTLGCYGFVGSGVVARGFALAQCLSVAGLLLALLARRKNQPVLSLAGGVVLGAASFTNYLAGFLAAAALLWGLCHHPRRLRQSVAMLGGLAPFLAVDFYVFVAQRASRIGQFEPFAWARLPATFGRAVGGALLGGLPLYFDGVPRVGAIVLPAMLLGAMLAVPVLYWRRTEPRDARDLWAMAALAAPLGLVAMGLASGSMPAEIRYLSFALPPFALLLAAALRSMGGGLVLRCLVLAVQTLSVTGLILRPETMQPEGTAARAAARAAGPNGLVLLPRGNDGVGVVAAFATAAPDGLRIALLEPDTALAVLRRAVASEERLVVVLFAVDRDSRSVSAEIKAATAAACRYPAGTSGTELLIVSYSRSCLLHS